MSTWNNLFSLSLVGYFSKLHETEVPLVRAFRKDGRRMLSLDKVVNDEDDETDAPRGRTRRRRIKRKATQRMVRFLPRPDVYQ